MDDKNAVPGAVNVELDEIDIQPHGVAECHAAVLGPQLGAAAMGRNFR